MKNVHRKKMERGKKNIYIKVKSFRLIKKKLSKHNLNLSFYLIFSKPFSQIYLKKKNVSMHFIYIDKITKS